MPKLTADEIITQRHRRSFLQLGGARPNNKLAFAGLDAQYFFISGVKVPQLGSITPIYVPSPTVQGKYRLVNRSLVAPGLPTATIIMHERHGSIPIQLSQLTCPFTIYDPTGTCAQLSDFNASGTDYWEVFSNIIITDKDLGARTSQEKDDAAADTLSVTLSDYYVMGPMPFGTKGAAATTSEVKDIIFGNKEQCGNCGPSDRGTNLIYACMDGTASPTAKPSVVYSLDGGLSWTAQAISAAANGDIVTAIVLAGTTLAVLCPLGTGGTGPSVVYVTTINTLTGAPSASWVKVAPSVFTVANTCNDMYVLSASEVFFCGQGGYIYSTSDLTSGSAYVVVDAGSASANNYNRIGGDDQDNMVIVGASNTVVKSTNRGTTWTATTTSPTGTLQAVWVLDRFRYWVGTAAGVLEYTLNGGETWSAQTFTTDTPAAVQDIAFPTDEVGYVIYTTAGTNGKLATTMDGGEKWTTQAPRIASVPACVRYNRIGIPQTSDSSINVNTLALAGSATGGVNGIIALGVASSL